MFSEQNWDMIICNSFFVDSIDSLGGRFSNLLRANNEGDGHQDQAVPHVEHQANLVEDTNDDGDNKKDKDDDDGDGDTAADDDHDDGRPQ